MEVKDVRVPEQLMRAMAAEAEAAREARAKVIAAEGEHKASRALRQAAEVIMDSPAALQARIILNSYFNIISLFQLRYLQTLNSISAENNSTIVFPVPIDTLAEFMSHSSSSPAPPSAQYPYNPVFQPPAPTHQPPPPPSTKVSWLITIIPSQSGNFSHLGGPLNV